MERHKAALLRWRRRRPSSMGKKPTTHIVDADREIPATFASGAKFSLCGVFLYESKQVAPCRSVVQEMPPAPALAPPDERPSRVPCVSLNSPFPPLGSPLRASADRPGPFRPPHLLNRSERVNRLFPQACVIWGSFPRTKPPPPKGGFSHKTTPPPPGFPSHKTTPPTSS